MFVGDGGIGVMVEGGGGADVLVMVGITTVTTKVRVGDTAADGTGVLVFTGASVAVGVPVDWGMRVSKEAPGVRKTSIQAGLVRMAGSRGSMKPTGRLVRKSLLGLRFDPMLEFSFQCGAKRIAHPLARMIQMSPNNRIRTMTMIELRLSFSRSRVCIETSLDGEAHIDGGAREGLFVMTGAFQPDASTMRVYDAA